MNFLQLAQQVREKAGISGTGPATVANQVGEMARIVNWTSESWEELQNKQLDWNWMRLECAFNTVAGQAVYSTTDAGLVDHAAWHGDTFRCYKTDEGRASEQFLVEIDYQDFRDSYGFGAMAVQTGRPAVFAVRPRDKALLIGPVPDGTYTITGDYQQSARPMMNNLDVPGDGRFPSSFHMAIVWLAVQKYAAYEGAGALFQAAQLEVKKIVPAMERNQLPAIEMGRPLA